MTININTTSLEELKTLNLKDLQAVAKEVKVKNWWTMKKADLLQVVADTCFTIQENLKKAEASCKGANEEAKKTQKAQAKKKAKAAKVEKDEENLVTLKELAAEFGMKGTKARRLLRDAAISRPYGGNRWEWDKALHIDELNMAREYLKAHTKAPKKEQGK